jgi:hypothetical protein
MSAEAAPTSAPVILRKPSALRAEAKLPFNPAPRSPAKPSDRIPRPADPEHSGPRQRGAGTSSTPLPHR